MFRRNGLTIYLIVLKNSKALYFSEQMGLRVNSRKYMISKN